jgi:hypothetical protein
VGAAIPTVPDHFSRLSFFPDGDDLDTHRHRELAVLTTDTFSEIYLFSDVAVLEWYFSQKLTHRAPPEMHFISYEKLNIVQGSADDLTRLR